MSRFLLFAGFDALIVMGGPMGAYEEGRFPWIEDELATIAVAVERRMPVLAVCLGAQLLARAAGGDAYAGHGPEVGVLPVRLTAAAGDDRLFGAVPATFTALQWHGDTFDLPPRPRCCWHPRTSIGTRPFASARRTGSSSMSR